MDAKTLKELKSLTRLNLVGDAYQLAATALGLTDLAAQFESINRQHLQAGELTWELNHDRHAVYDKMMAYAKAHMSADDYQKFYMLF